MLEIIDGSGDVVYGAGFNQGGGAGPGGVGGSSTNIVEFIPSINRYMEGVQVAGSGYSDTDYYNLVPSFAEILNSKSFGLLRVEAGCILETDAAQSGRATWGVALSSSGAGQSAITSGFLGFRNYVENTVDQNLHAVLIDGNGLTLVDIDLGVTIVDEYHWLELEIDGAAGIVRWRVDGAVVASYVVTADIPGLTTNHAPVILSHTYNHNGAGAGVTRFMRDYVFVFVE